VKIHLDLDSELAGSLLDSAVMNQRPMDWQAEVLLRQALGLNKVATQPVRADDNRALLAV
jgi:hypothetical protein